MSYFVLSAPAEPSSRRFLVQKRTAVKRSFGHFAPNWRAIASAGHGSAGRRIGSRDFDFTAKQTLPTEAQKSRMDGARANSVASPAVSAQLG